MTEVTVETVIKALEEVVAEKGEDYVYPNAGAECLYAIDGEPSCIVGHVIARLDPETFQQVVEFEDVNGSFGAGKFGTGVDAYVDYWGSYPAFGDNNVKKVLVSAQIAQDAGYEWKVALKEAKKTAAELDLES